MEKEKEKRWNEEAKIWEEKSELWLTEYEKYVLGEELTFRIHAIKSTRDKCGIDPNNKDAEPNKHIKVVLDICEKLGVDVIS